uniref:Uncharacterized protein n=1 Tax=Sphenodon punctatus TaxID=8508 RepID=A0A8D0GCQ4_SPHPU
NRKEWQEVAAVLETFVFYSPWRTEKQLYKLDVSWPKFPEYFTGQTFCVAVDAPNGLVYVAQRGANVPKILVFSEEGDFLQAWNSTIEMPHGMFLVNTRTGNSLWITDVGTDFKAIWLRGENGTGIGQFKIPHSVTVDSSGRVKQ